MFLRLLRISSELRLRILIWFRDNAPSCLREGESFQALQSFRRPHNPRDEFCAVLKNLTPALFSILAHYRLAIPQRCSKEGTTVTRGSIFEDWVVERCLWKQTLKLCEDQHKISRNFCCWSSPPRKIWSFSNEGRFSGTSLFCGLAKPVFSSPI